jgi:hypothetical protein
LAPPAVKVYGLVHPLVVATIADEAKKRGMRLSGHVSVGLSVTDAVRLGFNEIQHLNILMNNFFPDSLFVVQLKARAGGERLDPAGRMSLLRALDVDGPEATRLIEFLRDHGTVIVGTLNLYEDRGSPLADAKRSALRVDARARRDPDARGAQDRYARSGASHG